MHDIAEPIRRETAAQPRMPGIGATSPSREERTSEPYRHTPVAVNLCLREAAIVPAARLEHRIAALRAEIASAQRKRHGIDDAITSRSKTLTRLEAQLILERGAAPDRDA